MVGERAEGLSRAARPWNQDQVWPGAAYLVRQLRTRNLEDTPVLFSFFDRPFVLAFVCLDDAHSWEDREA